MGENTAALQAEPAAPVRNLGWRVTMAGVGINLALGVLYTWSVISKSIPETWGWSEAGKSLPYSIAILAFAFMTVPAGRLQDRIGPRIVATLGGLFVGLGMILASRTQSVAGYAIGFGLLAGAGIGLGYASATPPAIKWFPARRTGLIAGLVVGGFGLASAYAAPLATWLIASYGLPTAVMVFGIGFLLVVVLLAQLLINPPAGYKPQDSGAAATVAKVTSAPEDYNPGRMLATPQFWLLWLMYAFAAGAGLMIVGKLAKIVAAQGGIEKAGFAFVAILALGNAGGRVIAGTLSDRLGRLTTMRIVFAFQALLMLLLSRAFSGNPLGTLVGFTALSALIGANYGANLAVFPSVTKDYFGLKNFGVNYGLIFTAWGVGGFVMPYVCGCIYDANVAANPATAFVPSYYLAAGLLAIAFLLSFAVRPPAAKPA